MLLLIIFSSLIEDLEVEKCTILNQIACCSNKETYFESWAFCDNYAESVCSKENFEDPPVCDFLCENWAPYYGFCTQFEECTVSNQESCCISDIQYDLSEFFCDNYAESVCKINDTTNPPICNYTCHQFPGFYRWCVPVARCTIENQTTCCSAYDTFTGSWDYCEDYAESVCLKNDSHNPFVCDFLCDRWPEWYSFCRDPVPCSIDNQEDCCSNNIDYWNSEEFCDDYAKSVCSYLDFQSLKVCPFLCDGIYAGFYKFCRPEICSSQNQVSCCLDEEKYKNSLNFCNYYASQNCFDNDSTSQICSFACNLFANAHPWCQIQDTSEFPTSDELGSRVETAILLLLSSYVVNLMSWW